MSSAIQAVLKTAPRRATLKKIRNLASQKSAPVEFIPSNAYIIMGHGRDSDRMIQVPDNCMVVVKYRPAELADALNVFPLWNAVGAPENVEIYSDPLNHIPEVINQVGDVIIYKPGDLCPNFSYSLVWTEDNFFIDETPNHWGLQKIPLQSPVEMIPNKDEFKIKTFFPELYSGSVIPKGATVADVAIKLFKIGDDPSVNDCFALSVDVGRDEFRIKDGLPPKYPESPFTQFKLSFLYTQEQLFRLNSEGIAKRPGVYYNFVCRQVPKREFGRNPNGTHTNIINKYSSLLQTPKLTRGLLEKRIGEAETKRKQLLRGTKYNTPTTRKTRKHRK